MRAVFIKGASRYDATRLFTDELAAAFARQGHEAVVVDAMGQNDLLGALEVVARTPTDLVHTIACLGDARTLIGRSLSEIFDAPHVLQHVDYPLSHLNQLEATPAETAILTVDPSHVDAIRATFGPDHFAHVAYCQHAAVGEAAGGAADLETYLSERPIPILFTGSFYGERPAPWAEEGPGIRAVFDEALALALGSEFIPAVAAIDQVLRGFGENPEEPRYNQMRRYATWLHEQVRHVRRQKLLDAAGAAGLPVFCVGVGYEGWIERHPSFRLASPMTLTDIAALMRRARLVLNVNANFGLGSHERPLTAMLAGAAAATDGAWWGQQFVEGQDLVTYRWTHLETDVARIGALASDPEATWRMGLAGQAKVEAAHRFDHRVATVIAAADAAGAA